VTARRNDGLRRVSLAPATTATNCVRLGALCSVQGCWKRIVRRQGLRARYAVRTVRSPSNYANARAAGSGRERTRPAATRRMIRPAGAEPLGTIRSLAYFSTEIEEVPQLRAGPDYFQYLRHKLQRAAPAL
jgi:hypothetical protein